MEYNVQNNRIFISLPITTPTGKTRVKRPIQGYAPEPVACRSVVMQQNDFLEWQISYDTDSLQEPSVLHNVVLNKLQGVRYGCELVRLIVEGRKIGILAEAIFLELKELVYSVEIKIAHKQRAVGNQAMIYVHLPLSRCQSEEGQPFIGRCAERLEKAYYIVDSENIGVVYDTVVAFALASVDHRNDLRMIFDRL
jgi:hypothetical protein